MPKSVPCTRSILMDEGLTLTMAMRTALMPRAMLLMMLPIVIDGG
jgi:hypothetical protein